MTLDGQHPVHERPLEPNEKAVLAFVGMQGGWDVFFANGGSVEELYPVIMADPDDDLSGLRLIAEGSPSLSSRSILDGEPILEPLTARRWLLRSRQAEEVDGQLVLGDNPSHLALAGLSIVNSELPGLLSEAYEALADHPDTISPAVLRGIAQAAVSEGRPDEAAE